jgi:signal transduction histidine kinase
MKGKLLWSRLLDKIASVDIRAKILGIVAICFLLPALSMVWFTGRGISASLENELQERGFAIGYGLATQSRDLILAGNYSALYPMISSYQDSDEELLYVFILDPAGNVLAHAFSEGFPADLLVENQIKPWENYGAQTLQRESDQILDVAIPILGGQGGMVRLGLSTATISAFAAEHAKNTFLWGGLLSVVGLTAAYGLASILTNPISQLAEAAQTQSKGEFKWNPPVWAKGEIGKLGTAFNEMSQELKRTEQMRKHLLAKTLTAQEEERKRIARELHDETSQALTSLMVGLKFVENSASLAQVKERTAELRTLAAQTLDDVHHLATELRPSLLDDLGLVAAIGKYTREYSSKMKIKVDTHISSLSDKRLPSEIEVAVYRIVQEALTNVAKYSNTKNVSVILRYKEGTLIAIIEDNGTGFDVSRVMALANEKKLGLFGMYERASLIGGKLTIESRPGAGTTVFLEVQLKLPAEVLDEQDKITSSR